jgi:hypothetical protein
MGGALAAAVRKLLNLRRVCVPDDNTVGPQAVVTITPAVVLCTGTQRTFSEGHPTCHSRRLVHLDRMRRHSSCKARWRVRRKLVAVSEGPAAVQLLTGPGRM